MIEFLPESTLMSVLGTLIHILAVAEGPGGVPVCAGALEAAVEVGASSVSADSRTFRTLVFVDALLTTCVEAITSRTFTPEIVWVSSYDVIKIIFSSILKP